MIFYSWWSKERHLLVQVIWVQAPNESQIIMFSIAWHSMFVVVVVVVVVLVLVFVVLSRYLFLYIRFIVYV